MGEVLAEAVFDRAVRDLQKALVEALGGGRERAVEEVAAQGLDLVIDQLLAAVHLGQPELAVVIGLLSHLLDAVEIDPGIDRAAGSRLGGMARSMRSRRSSSSSWDRRDSTCAPAQHDLIGGGGRDHQTDGRRGGEGRLHEQRLGVGIVGDQLAGSLGGSVGDEHAARRDRCCGSGAGPVSAISPAPRMRAGAERWPRGDRGAGVRPG